MDILAFKLACFFIRKFLLLFVKIISWALLVKSHHRCTFLVWLATPFAFRGSWKAGSGWAQAYSKVISQSDYFTHELDLP